MVDLTSLAHIHRVGRMNGDRVFSRTLDLCGVLEDDESVFRRQADDLADHGVGQRGFARRLAADTMMFMRFSTALRITDAWYSVMILSGT